MALPCPYTENCILVHLRSLAYEADRRALRLPMSIMLLCSVCLECERFHYVKKAALLLTVTNKAFNYYEYGGTRTPDPQDRNLMLYPLSYIPSLFCEYTTVGKLRAKV